AASRQAEQKGLSRRPNPRRCVLSEPLICRLKKNVPKHPVQSWQGAPTLRLFLPGRSCQVCQLLTQRVVSHSHRGKHVAQLAGAGGNHVPLLKRGPPSGMTRGGMVKSV